MKNVLFVCTHGIGDLIMTLPTIRLMTSANYSVHVLLKGKPEEEVARYLLGDRNLSFGHLSRHKGSQAARFYGLVKEIRKQDFDFACAQYGVDPLLFSVLAFASGAKRRVGWKGPGSFVNTRSLIPGRQHKTLENARYLDVLGIEYSADDLRFSDSRHQDTIDSKVILMAPSAGRVAAHRAWPKANYAELAARLVTALDIDIELIGDKYDVALCDEIAAAAGSERVQSLAGQLDINGLFELFERRALLIANCNGVSHIASAVGVPVVGLYGPTSALHTGPFSPNLTTISRNLDCSPCYRRGYTLGCGNPVCMSGIPVDDVCNAILSSRQHTVSANSKCNRQPASTGSEIT